MTSEDDVTTRLRSETSQGRDVSAVSAFGERRVGFPVPVVNTQKTVSR
jgi:hypothetical protein